MLDRPIFRQRRELLLRRQLAVRLAHVVVVFGVPVVLARYSEVCHRCRIQHPDERCHRLVEYVSPRVCSSKQGEVC